MVSNWQSRSLWSYKITVLLTFTASRMKDPWREINQTDIMIASLTFTMVTKLYSEISLQLLTSSDSNDLCTQL